MGTAGDIFQTIESTCRRCIHRKASADGDCEYLSTGLRKVVGADAIWLTCDDFAAIKADDFERGNASNLQDWYR